MDPRLEITDRLRGQIFRAIQGGSLVAGSRLPPSRQLAAEFGVDHRVVLDAYRALEAEGLVELRARGGIYVAATENAFPARLPSSAWMTELLVQGINREIPIVELHEWLRRGVETLRLRVLVVERTPDQIAGLCRELTDYYGLVASGFEGDRLGDGSELASALRSTDLILTTSAFEGQLRPVVEKMGKRLLIAEVRPDLIGDEWRLLLRQKVYVIVKDHRFMAMAQAFFAGTPGEENLIPVVLGRDSIDEIPEDAPVYVTAGAREALGEREIRGRIIPPGRFLSTASAHELVSAIVEANLRAVAALRVQVQARRS